MLLHVASGSIPQPLWQLPVGAPTSPKDHGELLPAASPDPRQARAEMEGQAPGGV